MGEQMIKWNINSVKDYFIQKNEILLDDEYKNSYSKITVQCENNHIYTTTLNRHMRGKRCPYCYEFKRQQKIKEAIDYFSQYDYTVVGDFLKLGESVSVICDNGHLTKMRFEDFKRGHRCKYCTKNNIKYTINEIRDYYKNYGYEFLDDEYINNKTKHNIKCPNGHITKMRLDSFKRGIRCSQCNCSSGEAEIMRILNNNNIDFEFQYIFDDCVDLLPLPFDFYIPSLNICIEFDGEEHYRPIEWFDGELGFKKRKMHDNIKDEYCITNEINLIRIPYWDIKNIEQILKDKQII